MESNNNVAQADLNKIAQLELEIKKLKEENSKLVNSQVSLKSIIEEMRIFENQFKNNQFRFKTIFERSKFGNKILNRNLEIIEANEAFVTMLGFKDKNEVINKKILDFAHPDFIHEWHKLQVALWKEKIPAFSIETCLIKENKSSFWCHVTSILFEDEQGILGYTIVEDINERKALERKTERLYENQEMVMYMVAHDLKSPLNTIQALGNIIKKDIETHDEDQALLHLSLLEKTRDMGDGILDDLILIGELESGSIEKEVVDVVDILRSLVEQVDAVAKKKEVQVIQEFPQTTVFAKVNKVKLSRVISNVLSNAIKFSNAGGKVSALVTQDGSNLLLQIKDQGIGIPIEIQPEVFNKFTMAKRKGTQGEHTTGLGLYISRRIVAVHHGQIWFESKPNEGTTFFISIPLTD